MATSAPTFTESELFSDTPELDFDAWPAHKKSLYRAAIELFYEQGFDATGVQQIASRAALSKGTLYHYFDTKDTILRVISERFLARLMPGITAIRDEGLPPAEAIHRVCHLMVEIISEHREEVVIFYEEWRHMSKEFFARTKAKRDAVADVMTEIVASAVESGEFRRIGPDKLVGFTIFGVCSYAQYWYDPDAKMSPAELGRLYGDLIVGGLTSR
ncbi:MAG TPA: TetR/AcrR family transcriptional regulator [Pseudonocardia sp.]|jgi:AcrR family transcriptional regulator|nr:TetR/AcrR family transcriptional regulator [Pseudonocardia sp.]